MFIQTIKFQNIFNSLHMENCEEFNADAINNHPQCSDKTKLYTKRFLNLQKFMFQLD